MAFHGKIWLTLPIVHAIILLAEASNLSNEEPLRSEVHAAEHVERVIWCKRDASHVFMSLSRPQTMLEMLNVLYTKYGEELALLHSKMKRFCEIVRSCKFCDREAEMLYIQVREWKPLRVFEMAPNRGYSTHFILSALKANGQGHLDSFDIHGAANRTVSDPELRAYWSFHKQDVMEYILAHPGMMTKYDFIFIDALHTLQFSRWYTKSLLSHQVRCETPVIIHDIVAGDGFGGRESLAVYAYMAFQQDVNYVFTLNSAAGIPTPFATVQGNAGALYEAIRARHNCTGSQKYFACKGRDPSVFFLINTAAKNVS